ncbi:Gfo/Idh/MocA family oxidoreductase, partial [bacterium]|nr:Gfo/Idh/MocA family oxidoreductase [bacterium]
MVVIGCGDASLIHLDACLKHESRVRVIAACDPDAQRLQQFCEKYHIGKSFVSVDDLLTKCSFDVAIVCTPTPLRFEIIKRLAESEKHILVENPLADGLAEARKIVEVCQAAGVGLAVNHNYRYHYGFELAKSIVAEGTIGAVLGAVHQDLTFRQDNGWMARSNRHALA